MTPTIFLRAFSVSESSRASLQLSALDYLYALDPSKAAHQVNQKMDSGPMSKMTDVLSPARALMTSLTKSSTQRGAAIGSL